MAKQRLKEDPFLADNKPGRLRHNKTNIKEV
jgi:hypothetical protein